MGNQHAAAVRRDGGPLNSAVQERQQKKAAAGRHQAAAREKPPASAREGARPGRHRQPTPKIGLRDLVGKDGRQHKMAEISRAETPHIDPRLLEEPTAKPRLEARCELVGLLKTDTKHHPPTAMRRIIQVARVGV
jgi:hypothetical protein